MDAYRVVRGLKACIKALVPGFSLPFPSLLSEKPDIRAILEITSVTQPGPKLHPDLLAKKQRQTWQVWCRYERPVHDLYEMASTTAVRLSIHWSLCLSVCCSFRCSLFLFVQCSPLLSVCLMDYCLSICLPVNVASPSVWWLTQCSSIFS